MNARVVLLGASNLTLGFRAVLGLARGIAGGPVDVLAAVGHGRSYGAPTRVLGRGLCGIVGCGLWDALSRASGEPAYSLVTDVGNDIPHGVPLDVIGGWIETCLERLERSSAQTALTLLPVGSLERLGRLRYLAFRSVLFPRSRLTLGEVLSRARGLNDLLREAARRRGAVVIEPDERWYGLDPIHLRRRIRDEAWSRILSPWRPAAPALAAPSPLPRLPPLRPEAWSLFGVARRRAQPCARLPGGDTIALY